MRITISGDKFIFSAYDSLLPSYELPLSANHLERNCSKLYWTADCEIDSVVDDLVTEFSLYENGNGLSLYENHWMPFPKAEYQELKEYALKLEKEASPDGDLFCNTY